VGVVGRGGGLVVGVGGCVGGGLVVGGGGCFWGFFGGGGCGGGVLIASRNLTRILCSVTSSILFGLCTIRCF